MEPNTRSQQIPAHRAPAGPKAAQQAPRFPSPSPTSLTRFLLLPWLFPTAPRNLSAPWGYRRIGTVGGMDAAYEPPWMDSRRVPIRRQPQGARTTQASRPASKANQKPTNKKPKTSGRQAATTPPPPFPRQIAAAPFPKQSRLAARHGCQPTVATASRPLEGTRQWCGKQAGSNRSAKVAEQAPGHRPWPDRVLRSAHWPPSRTLDFSNIEVAKPPPMLPAHPLSGFRSHRMSALE